METSPDISLWHFWKVVEDSPDGIQIIDLDGKIIYSNKAAERIYGYGSGEFDIKSIDDVDANAGFLSCVIIPGVRQAGRWSGELKVKHKEGRFIVVNLTASLIKDEAGSPSAVILMLKDITRHKWAEEELIQHQEDLEGVVEERTSELRKTIEFLTQEIAEREHTENALAEERQILKTLFEFSPVGIAMGNAEGMAIRTNKAFREMLGYSEEELKQMTFRDFSHKDDIDYNMRLFNEMLMGRRDRYRLQKRFIGKDGRVIWANVSVAAVRDAGGRFLHNFVIVEDITDRKKLEEEIFRADKLESIGILAGGIAHDFNNILTTILSNVSLAKFFVDHKEALLKKLATIEKATLRAQSLTQQLLTFSMGGAPVKKTASIKELIEESVDFSLRGSRVRCELCIQEDIWHVDVDEAQMSQVIGNLIINADQSMPEGGIINIGAENVTLSGGLGLPLEGKYVKLSFRDKGVGIPREYLAKIFDPFFTTKQKGSGLGLTTAYSIIKKHNGHITVESMQGHGTTFHLYLPASENVFANQEVYESALIRGSGRILVMDDEPDIRESLGNILAICGYEVDFASDGQEAVRLYCSAMANEAPFDAVIMDLTIPGGMGGKETIKRLREYDPEVRAIVSSGYSNDPVMSDFKGYGFSGVISKPYRAEAIVKAINEVIGKHP